MHYQTDILVLIITTIGMVAATIAYRKAGGGTEGQDEIKAHRTISGRRVFQGMLLLAQLCMFVNGLYWYQLPEVTDVTRPTYNMLFWIGATRVCAVLCVGIASLTAIMNYSNMHDIDEMAKRQRKYEEEQNRPRLLGPAPAPAPRTRRGKPAQEEERKEDAD